MQDSALLLIEIQQEWLSPSGKLHRLIPAEHLRAAVEAQGRLLAAARAAAVPIIHAHQDFSDGHQRLGAAEHGLRRAMRHHDVWSGEGRRAAEGFEPAPGEHVLAARTGASAFTGTHLDALLRNNGVRRLVVAGFAAHVCLLATVIQAHELGYTAVVPHEATAAFTAEQHRFVVHEVAPHFAWSKPLAATLDHLERRAGAVQAVGAFLAALTSGDTATLARLIDVDARVEGDLEGSWVRWDRSAYLERVQRMAPALADCRVELGGLHLVGVQAEADTRLHLAHGTFHDRLSWFRGAEGWTLRHKGFQCRPGAET